MTSHHKSLFPRSGFSLAEVAIAVAILALSLTTLLGLIPSVMTNIRKASNLTAENRIVSEITGRIELGDWGNPSAPPFHWSNLSEILAQRWYFDDQGNPIKTSDSGFGMRLSYVATAELAPSSEAGQSGQVTLPGNGNSSAPPTTNSKVIHVRVAGTTDASFNFSNPSLHSTYVSVIARQF